MPAFQNTIVVHTADRKKFAYILPPLLLLFTKLRSFWWLSTTSSPSSSPPEYYPKNGVHQLHFSSEWIWALIPFFLRVSNLQFNHFTWFSMCPAFPVHKCTWFPEKIYIIFYFAILSAESCTHNPGSCLWFLFTLSKKKDLELYPHKKWVKRVVNKNSTPI